MRACSYAVLLVLVKDTDVKPPGMPSADADLIPDLKMAGKAFSVVP